MKYFDKIYILLTAILFLISINKLIYLYFSMKYYVEEAIISDPIKSLKSELNEMIIYIYNLHIFILPLFPF